MCPIIGALLYLMASLMVLEDGKSLHNGVLIWDKLAANFTEYLSTAMNTHSVCSYVVSYHRNVYFYFVARVRIILVIWAWSC